MPSAPAAMPTPNVSSRRCAAVLLTAAGTCVGAVSQANLAIVSAPVLAVYADIS
jgi:hypothetical protein